MARRSFKADKRRRQLQKKKKQEEKRQKKQTKDGPEGEDKSYLEYLSPGGPMDERYVEEEEEKDEDGEENGDADGSDADRET
ncbi:MAG: hypothetical protein GVY23_03125 [Spirochaetes bacterium]|jgi:hypothetical protein|nr:hypothetical protein [Spirochaetota bacterium]